MTTLTNSAEGGTSGTNATPGNTGGASGNAADAITTAATCTVTFDNAHAAHGLLSYNMTYGGTAGNIAFDWSTSMGTQAQIWFRFYLFLTANPSINLRFWGCKAATACANLVINNAGKLVFFNAAGTTLITSTNTVPLSSWFRVEGFVIGSSTTGQVEFKLFTTPDGTVPLETKTSSATANTNTSPSTYIFGNEGVTTSGYTYWQDDLGLSNTGYVGPVVLAAGAGGLLLTPPGLQSPGALGLGLTAPSPAPQSPGAGQATGYPLTPPGQQSPMALGVPLTAPSPGPQSPPAGQATGYPLTPPGRQSPVSLGLGLTAPAPAPQTPVAQQATPVEALVPPGRQSPMALSSYLMPGSTAVPPAPVIPPQPAFAPLTPPGRLSPMSLGLGLFAPSPGPQTPPVVPPPVVVLAVPGQGRDDKPHLKKLLLLLE